MAPRKPNPLLDAGAAAEARRRLAVLDRIEARLDLVIPGWRTTYFDAAVAFLDAVGGSRTTLDAIEIRLSETLGESWRHTYGSVDAALREPYVLRRLGGPPSDDRDMLIEASQANHMNDLARALGLDPCSDAGEPTWDDLLAEVVGLRAKSKADDELITQYQVADSDADLAVEPVTAIDDTTPEGVLALLDAAADALAGRGDYELGAEVERVRDAAARLFDLPRRMRQWAYDAGAYRPRASSPIDRQASTLSAHDSAVLLGLLLADAADLPSVLRAAIGGRGMGETEAVERIAATATALAGKLRAKGGESW